LISLIMISIPRYSFIISLRQKDFRLFCYYYPEDSKSLGFNS